MEKICSFCGHGKEWDLPMDIDIRIEVAVSDLISKNVNVFYSGGMGAFDSKCEAVILKLKQKYKDLKLILIIPYLTKTLDDISKAKKYDEIIFPDLGRVHYKSAIQKRNRWMIDRSDFLLSYVKNSTGGARQSFEYAKRKGIDITEL